MTADEDLYLNRKYGWSSGDIEVVEDDEPTLDQIRAMAEQDDDEP